MPTTEPDTATPKDALTDLPRRGFDLTRSGKRQLREGALETADRLVHLPGELVRHAVSSVVVVDVDVNVEVDVTPGAARAVEAAGPALARG